MCNAMKRTVKNMTGTGVEDSETINGLLRQTNTLDGKPIIKRTK